MNYPFECSCGNKETISMPMTEYDPHQLCSVCGKEMHREVSSLVCRSIDKTNSFFKKTSI